MIVSNQAKVTKNQRINIRFGGPGGRTPYATLFAFIFYTIDTFVHTSHSFINIRCGPSPKINIGAKCLKGVCRLLYRKETNTEVLGIDIINHSEVENHRGLSSCNKPEPCILINILTYRTIF